MSTESVLRLDERRVEAFAEQLFGLFTGGMLTYMIDIGHRTGLFDAAAEGPGTSTELADRAGLQERYVREWAGALTTGGILEYDPATRAYALPPEHAACLTGSTSANLAPISLACALLAKNLRKVERAFREGGGVPYDDFRPEFAATMDGMSRGLFDEMLIPQVLPLVGALVERLAGGIRVADIGCGTGHAVNLMAQAYPASSFIGYDLGTDAIAAARNEAAEMGLVNASFEVLDVTALPSDPPFDAIFAFDAIHDQARPAAALAAAHEALAPGGWFVMMDINTASNVEDNIGNPLAPWIYAVSTLHCMTVSLAEGGAGLGTAWGRQLAESMLTDAGFRQVDVHDVPGDPFDLLYVCRA